MVGSFNATQITARVTKVLHFFARIAVPIKSFNPLF